MEILRTTLENGKNEIFNHKKTQQRNADKNN